jgi:hypothetical protein
MEHYGQLVWATHNEDGFDVELWQSSPDEFTVRYGLQIATGLSYIRAAHELGECLMHQLGVRGSLA